MSSNVRTIGLKGLEGYLITVEVRTIPGIHSIIIVGLPDASVKEAKQRISAAFHSLDYFLHPHKIIVNLSPAEQRKNGPLFDLPIAIGILLSLQEIILDIPDTTGFIGALSLDGSIHPAEGMLPAVLAAKRLGLTKLYLPFDHTLPLIEIEGLDLIYVKHMKDVLKHLSGIPIPKFYSLKSKAENNDSYSLDFQQIIGHTYAKHALEIAAAGEHHILLSGPPGCGKSLLAESFPSILPPLSKEDQLEMLSIYQLSGVINEHSLLPPYRNPHHSSSGVSIIGGGQNPKPGEISLAHHGVLFLDEIAEFPKKTLDMLRQPLENEVVTISRARSTVTYPSSFILIGAMNPCPCGYLGAKNRYCTCTSKQISTYQNRLSGPMRDRFDIFLSLTPVDLRSSSKSYLESSKLIQERVIQTRMRQFHRYGREITNGRVPFEELIKTNPLTEKQGQFLQILASKNNWSNRVQIKIIRIARTIADLQQKIDISDQNIWEAIKVHGWKNAEKIRKKHA